MATKPRASLHPPTRIDATTGRTIGRNAGWNLTVCPDAFEAGGSFKYERQQKRAPGYGPPDQERSAKEADKRARRNIRQYIVANRLNRMGVLTYAEPGCHDPADFRRDIAAFWKRLRTVRGGKAFPYLWVPEWHKTQHGLHGHFAVGGFVRRSHLVEAWPHGFVYIKLIGDLPVGSSKRDEARAAAGYLSKYLGKEVGHERVPGLHRYDVAQEFQPQTLEVWGRTLGHAIDAACDVFGGARPSWSWTSDEFEDWAGPPSVSLRWDG